MAHLWSGRFEGDPDAALVAFGRSFGFDRRLFEDDVRGSMAWAGALARAGVLSPADAAAIQSGLEDVLSSGSRRGILQLAGGTGRRGRPRVCRARARRAHRRRRTPPPHRPVAQRTGCGRSAAVPQTPRARAAAVDRRAGWRPRRQRRARRRRADAVVYAPAPRAADSGRALLSRARRGVAARSRAADHAPR